MKRYGYGLDNHDDTVSRRLLATGVVVTRLSAAEEWEWRYDPERARAREMERAKRKRPPRPRAVLESVLEIADEIGYDERRGRQMVVEKLAPDVRVGAAGRAFHSRALEVQYALQQMQHIDSHPLKWGRDAKP